MKHFFVEETSLPQAYHAALRLLSTEGKQIPCPDYSTDMLEIAMTFAVAEPFAEPMVSRLYPGGTYELQQYVLEVCDGILDFMVGAAENTWEYTYSLRIKGQIPWLLDELRRNPHSRRAVIDVRDTAVDAHNDHPACLQHIQFLNRDGKLHMKVLMRSNDAVNATFMNAFAFIMLQKRIADELGLAVGSYTHTANSFHAYAKDWKMLRGYMARLDEAEGALTYDYASFYKDVMAAEIPKIMAMVAEQKRKYNIE